MRGGGSSRRWVFVSTAVRAFSVGVSRTLAGRGWMCLHDLDDCGALRAIQIPRRAASRIRVGRRSRPDVPPAHRRTSHQKLRISLGLVHAQSPFSVDGSRSLPSASKPRPFLDLSRLDQESLVHSRAVQISHVSFPGKPEALRGPDDRPDLIRRVFAVAARCGARHLPGGRPPRRRVRLARAATHGPRSSVRIPRARRLTTGARRAWIPTRGAERERARARRTRSVAASLGGVRAWRRAFGISDG